MLAKIKKTLVSLAIMITPLFAVSGVFMTTPVYAGDESAAGGSGSCGSPVSIFPAWYDGLCDGDGGIKSPNEMEGSDTGAKLGKWITVIALNIVTMLLYVVGYVSLGFTIYGGFKYMISGDTASGTQAARKTITNAVIGLVLSIMSVAIVKLVTGAIVA